MLACKYLFNRERAEDQLVSIGEEKKKERKKFCSVIQRKYTAEGYVHHPSSSVNLILFKK